jgi:TPP-dependent pyruvate/acetoin dehydrogenase alpha subunit
MAMKTYEDAMNASSNHGSALISDARLRELYRTMLKCRMLTEHLDGANGSRGAFIGFEAPAVALAIDLKAGDSFSATQHHAAFKMVRGNSLESVLQADRNGAGASAKASGEETTHMLPALNDISTQVNVAAGVALANKMRGSDNVVIVFLPPGAGPHHLPAEALRLAMHERLALILVAQEAATKSADDNVAWDQNALPVIPVDGSDVVAVYRVRQESMARARRGSGPTLIDCRMSFAGSTSRSNGARSNGHRSPDRDPLQIMAAYLAARGLFTDAWRTSLAASFAQELKAAAKHSAQAKSKRRSR